MKTLNSLVGVLLFCSISFCCYSQNRFKSIKYGYSFTIPDEWHEKQKTYAPGVDGKVIDGKGNSFIISIKPTPTEIKDTPIEDILGDVTDSELLNIFNATTGDSYVLKRGTYYIDGKKWYYIHLSDPFKDGLRLIHKMFFYNDGHYSYTLDCCSISSMEVDTSPDFNLMLITFKFK